MGQGWRIRLQPNLAANGGQCKPEKKMVLSKYVDRDELELKILLLHELCHAKAMGHGVKFITVTLRVLKTIVKKCHSAKNSQLPLEELNRHIQDSWKLYEEWKKEIQKYIDVYGISDDPVLLLSDWTSDAPDQSYNELRQATARHFGLNLKNFDKWYGKRAQKSYRSIKESLKQQEILKRKLQGAEGQ